MARGEYFTFKSLQDLRRRVEELGLAGELGFADLAPGAPLKAAEPLRFGPFELANRFVAHPMEGWDADAETGAPTPDVIRRWERMGASGAALIWGVEAFALAHEYRANPHQLVLAPENEGAIAEGLKRMRAASPIKVSVGAQLTCSGRYSHGRPKGSPLLLTYHHPELDRRLGAGPDTPLMSDMKMEDIVGEYARAARIAVNAGFDFLDIKACHRYWLNETLAAKTRPGNYGGPFENRVKIFLMIVDAVRREVGEGVPLGTRLNAYDGLPFEEDPATRSPGLKGRGRVSPFTIPYVWGWGMDEADPTRADLAEPSRLLGLLKRKGLRMVNLSSGSPYSNPHFSRPTETPPVDGYQPHHDPLIEVARQFSLARALKKEHPDLSFVGTGYSYLRHHKLAAAEHNLRRGDVDAVGLGRALLAYPDEIRELLTKGEARPSKGKIVCTGDSACTTGPRLGLNSGCIFDPHYQALMREIQGKLVEQGLGRK